MDGNIMKALNLVFDEGNRHSLVVTKNNKQQNSRRVDKLLLFRKYSSMKLCSLRACRSICDSLGHPGRGKLQYSRSDTS